MFQVFALTELLVEETGIMNDGERKCFQKKKKKILASSFYKSGSIQTLRHLKGTSLIIPIATRQNLGFGNTRPRRLGSVDVSI